MLLEVEAFVRKVPVFSVAWMGSRPWGAGEFGAFLDCFSEWKEDANEESDHGEGEGSDGEMRGEVAGFLGSFSANVAVLDESWGAGFGRKGDAMGPASRPNQEPVPSPYPVAKTR